MTTPTVVRALVLAIAAIAAAGVAQVAFAQPGAMDLVAQYAAGSLVLAGKGSAVLDPSAVLAAEHAAAPERTALLPFVQPPAVALLLAPLALLPYDAAFRVMAALDALTIALALALLRPALGPLGGALLLVAPPAAIAVAQGQTAPLVLLFVAVASRSRGPAGGLALGLSLIRPQTAPLLLLAGIADRARRPWTIAGALVVIVASAAVVGPAGLVRYGSTLVDAAGWSASGELGLATGIGWSALAVALGAGRLGLVASIVGLAAGAVAVARADPAERPRVAAAWSLVASPHALMHDALLAYPTVARVASRAAAWDVASAFAWLAHVAVAPVGVVWSLVLVLRGSYPRPAR